ncbi:hypothetical protein PPERSA_01053 [Pseudocohnilembus persalinus]|uniref:Kinase domain protein n=1 Tax=Pseudocohnilembus persalinus TaxID=266149 RepID=A0A0V0QUQ8_PSEPJ|nr:hypothetical protein PPERSA_01053 [Pseudocohnilembus persalinus]|eukprot:KRX05975.1 hypothetical protein PPERSA_01053 [Pseudocohnilembus persalinus]
MEIEQQSENNANNKMEIEEQKLETIVIQHQNQLIYAYDYEEEQERQKELEQIRRKLIFQIKLNKGNGASVPLIFQNQYFKYLTGLKILIGSGSQKSSNDFKYITDFISKCGQKLSNLDIDIGNNNNLKETSVQQLSQALAKQQELRNLVIKIGQYNKIKDQSLALLGQALSCTKIQSFSLTLYGYNDIKYSGIGGLFYKWGCFQYIKQFQLDLGLNNNMGSLGLIGMGKALQKMKKLQQLSITFRKKNIKNIQDFIHLLANLKHLKQIRYLKLIIREENEIGYDGALAISHCIQNIPNLIGVHLNFGGANNINKDGFYQIYKGIQNCKNLQSLEFYQKDDIIWGQKDFQVLVDLLRDPIFTFIKVNDSILFTYNFMDITMIMDLDETNMYDLDHSIIQKFRVFRKFKFGLTSWTNKNQNQLSGLVNVFLNNTSNIPQFNLIFGDAEEYSPILIYKSLPPVQAIQPVIEFENQKKWKEDYKMVSEFFDDDFGDVLAIYINFYRLCLKINDPNFSHNQFLSNLVKAINTTMAKKLSLKILALIPEGDVNGRFLNVLSGVFNEMLLLVRPESYLEKIVIESLDNFYIEYQKDKYFEIVYEQQKIFN